MKAIRLRGHEGLASFFLEEAPEPVCRPGEVRVAVRASALNRADLLQAKGRYPAPPGVPADIPGLEFAGEVLEAPPDEPRWRPGDRVMGIVGGGAFAEQLVTPASALLPVPAGMSFTDAAAIPEAFLTAHDAAFTQGGLRPGGSLLIHAVGSGVGSAALQLALAQEVLVVGTSRSAWKLEQCRDALGLEQGVLVDADPPRFADAVEAAIRAKRPGPSAGVDVVLDLVGGGYVNESLRCLRRQGTLMLVGLLAGAQSPLDLSVVLLRRLRLVGTTLRSRSTEEKADATARFAEQALPLFEQKKLRPLVADCMPMADVRAAAARMASNDLLGKLVLAW